MGIGLAITLTILLATVAMLAHARWSVPEFDPAIETMEVAAVIGPAVAALPPRRSRDVLDDLQMLLDFDVMTATSAAEHRLLVLESLLEEADHETVRLELLVNKLGRELMPAESWMDG